MENVLGAIVRPNAALGRHSNFVCTRIHRKRTFFESDIVVGKLRSLGGRIFKRGGDPPRIGNGCERAEDKSFAIRVSVAADCYFIRTECQRRAVIRLGLGRRPKRNRTFRHRHFDRSREGIVILGRDLVPDSVIPGISEFRRLFAPFAFAGERILHR